MSRVRILLADDQALFPEGLQALLDAHPDIDVVGTAPNGEAAVLRSKALLPDVVPWTYVCPVSTESPRRGVWSKVVAEFARLSRSPSPARPHAGPLSERELDVLRCLARGGSNKEIAAQLRIAEGTVKNHMTNIFEKLDVEDRTRAALRARELGLI